MNKKLQDVAPRSSARRQLVRGAFAAPAVLTLHSGSAFAVTSATSCLAKANLNPVSPAPTPTNADDGYFRYRLWTVKNNGGQVQSAWVKGADLAVYYWAGAGSPFLSLDQWQEFGVESNKSDSYNQLIGSPTITTPSAGNGTFLQDGPYVVLRIDAGGSVVGVGATGPGTAVGDSCWNSFALQVPLQQ